MCNEPGVNYAIKAAAQGKASFARRGAALRVFFLPLLFVASRAVRSAGGGELVASLSCSCTVAVFPLLVAPWMTASFRSRVVVRYSGRQAAPQTQAAASAPAGSVLARRNTRWLNPLSRAAVSCGKVFISLLLLAVPSPPSAQRCCCHGGGCDDCTFPQMAVLMPRGRHRPVTTFLTAGLPGTPGRRYSPGDHHGSSSPPLISAAGRKWTVAGLPESSPALFMSPCLGLASSWPPPGQAGRPRCGDCCCGGGG